MLELRQADGDHDKLRTVANAVVKAACDGDMRATAQFADRLDGKARQELTVGGEAEQPLIVKVVNFAAAAE